MFGRLFWRRKMSNSKVIICIVVWSISRSRTNHKSIFLSYFHSVFCTRQLPWQFFVCKKKKRIVRQCNDKVTLLSHVWTVNSFWGALIHSFHSKVFFSFLHAIRFFILDSFFIINVLKLLMIFTSHLGASKLSS